MVAKLTLVLLATLMLTGVARASDLDQVPISVDWRIQGPTGSDGGGFVKIRTADWVIRGSPTDSPGMGLELAAVRAVVRVYERTIAHLELDEYSHDAMLRDANLVQETWHDRATLDRLTFTSDWTFLLIGIRTMEWPNASKFVIDRPLYRIQVAGPDVAGRNPLEPFRYELPDARLPVDATVSLANITSVQQFWMFNGTFRIQDGNGTHHVSVSYEHESPLAQAETYRVRWAEVELHEASGVVFFNHLTNSSIEKNAFAIEIEGVGSGDLWVDVGAGRLASDSIEFETDGSLLRVAGNLDFKTSELDPHAGSYSLSIRGTANYMETSEGVWFDNRVTGLAMSTGLITILVMVGFFLRDLLARGLGAIVLAYTKLRKPQLLDHDRRQALFDLVKNDPGITFLQIHEKLKEHFGRAGGFGFGSLTYHLSQLERFGLIISKREGRFRRYFENGGRFGRDTQRIAVLQTPPIPRVVEIVLAEPGASQTRIHEYVAEEHAVTRQAVSYHLRRLIEHELLTVERAGKAKAYSPTEKLRELAVYAEEKTASLQELKSAAAASG